MNNQFIHVLPKQVFHSNYRAATLYEALTRQTQEHILYLSEIGLGERAKGIKLSIFDFKEHVENINLTSFNKRMAFPEEILHFDPILKNTIITTDPKAYYNKSEDLQKILDIRLYPVLRNLIKENRVEIFLGSKKEMVAYYKSKHAQILFQFTIPSSAIYYLAESDKGELFVVMGGLVSRENIIAQLLTLKLAGIQLNKIEIIGEVDHFTQLVHQDMQNLQSQIAKWQNGNNVLIVAGCGLEETVNEIIANTFPNQTLPSQSFKGDIVSLTYTPLLKPLNGISGFISLDLNYGEITEEIIRLLLEDFNCRYIFTGGAGGFISNQLNKEKPAIGNRISISQSMNEQGEIVNLSRAQMMYSQSSAGMHLQVASIFLETYDWLKKAKHRGGTSVDVETFYIIRAIQNYNAKYPSNFVKADCGYFISDYVGEQALREYSKVYQNYQCTLLKFLDYCIK